MTNFEDIESNWKQLRKIINKSFTGDRKDKLNELYDHLEERMATMPASSKTHHHNCFPGGYVDHVLRVIKFAMMTHELWTEMGVTVNYTQEELIFAALNHDLGKVGTLEEECYIPQTSAWHRDRGELYTFNTKNPFGTVPDRSLFILQQKGITISQNEFLAIKLHDGLYEESNRSYFMSNFASSKLRTALPYILHHADMAASRIEYEHWALANSPTTIDPRIDTRP